MLNLRLKDIVEILGGKTESKGEALERVVTGYTFDSRKTLPGNLFFALKGEKRNGHQFVGDARSKGAIGAVVEHEIEGLPEDFVQVVVTSSLASMQSLAAYVRDAMTFRVVAVTGSNGKTTTKEMLAVILSQTFRVSKSPGNFNNHIGVPISILSMESDDEILVLEIASNHRGEIAHLARIAKPDVAIVTNVGRAHIGNFGSLEAVAAEKSDLLRSLETDGVGVVNADDAVLMGSIADVKATMVKFGLHNPVDFQARDISVDNAGITRFEISGTRFELTCSGLHNIYNSLAAVAASSVFGIKLEETAKALRHFEPIRMKKMLAGEWTIIDDSYNSNPDSVRAALESLSAAQAARKVFIMGEMLELGETAEALHAEIGKLIPDMGFSVLIGIGRLTHFACEQARDAGLAPSDIHFFETKEEAKLHLFEILEPGDLVLIKGSRLAGLEEITNLIKMVGVEEKS